MGLEHRCYLIVILVSLRRRCSFLLFSHNLQCILGYCVWHTLFTLYFCWGFVGSALCEHFLFSLLLCPSLRAGVWSGAVRVPSARPAHEHSLHSLPAPAQRQRRPLLNLTDQRRKPLGMFAYFLCLVMPFVYLASAAPSWREYCHVLKGWKRDFSVWVFFPGGNKLGFAK